MSSGSLGAPEWYLKPAVGEKPHPLSPAKLLSLSESIFGMLHCWPMTPLQNDGKFVEALARGLTVIQCFDQDHAEMSLSEVARRTNLTPSTARRCLHTLVSLGYICYVNKRFLLSPRVLTLGSAYLQVAHAEEVLRPELRRVVSLFGDAASVSVLDGMDILYLAHVSEQRALRPTARVGITYPAYATSMGRVLLAGLSDLDLERYLARVKLQKLTDLTETDPDKLRDIVRGARKNGYATAMDQLAYGVTSLAVPISVGNGKIVAALNSSGYTRVIKLKKMIEERLVELRTSAGRLGSIFALYPALLHSIVRSTGEREDIVHTGNNRNRGL